MNSPLLDTLDRFKDLGWVMGELLCTSMDVVVKN